MFVSNVRVHIVYIHAHSSKPSLWANGQRLLFDEACAYAFSAYVTVPEIAETRRRVMLEAASCPTIHYCIMKLHIETRELIML